MIDVRATIWLFILTRFQRNSLKLYLSSASVLKCAARKLVPDLGAGALEHERAEEVVGGRAFDVLPVQIPGEIS